ncbi:MAG: hypothetical protein ACHQVS_05050 [Candidatus Babeliales bacterium]
MNIVKNILGLCASLCIISTLQAAEARPAKKSFMQGLTQILKKKKTKAELTTEVAVQRLQIAQLKKSLYNTDTDLQAEVKGLIKELERTKEKHTAKVEKLKIKLAGVRGDAHLLSEDIVTLAAKVNKQTKEKAALLERTEKRHTEIEGLYRDKLAQTKVALATERAKSAALEAELKRRTDLMKSPVQAMYA